MSKKDVYKIKGMDCASCAALIELELEDIGVAASCSYAAQTLTIKDNKQKHPEERIKEAVKKAGYELH